MQVKFVECSDSQARFGRSQDPRSELDFGATYDVDEVEVHSFHTLYHINGGKYNSVCFEEINNIEEN